MNRARILASVMTMSAVGFAAWQASEGDGPMQTRADGIEVHLPYIPTKGDVATIGNGSTRYEDGTPVRMTDPPITRQRAEELARNLHAEEERRFIASLPGVYLHSEEFDLYLNFSGQFGGGNWRKPQSPRTWLLRGDYAGACNALLTWRFQAGRDCKLPQNWGPQGCKGVWTRQLKRHADCVAAL